MSHCSSAVSFDMLDRSDASSECSESWERLEKSPAPSENAESCSSVKSFDMLDDSDVRSLNGEESDESFLERELREIGSKTPTPQGDVELSDNSKDCRSVKKMASSMSTHSILQPNSSKVAEQSRSSDDYVTKALKSRLKYVGLPVSSDDKDMIPEEKVKKEVHNIKTDKIQERVDKRIGPMQEMREAFVKEMVEYAKQIEENPQLAPSKGLLPVLPLPDITLDYIRRWL